MKILIVILGKIGDMILATTMFKLIKEHLPDAEIHVLAGRHNFHLLKTNPNVDRIFIYEKTPRKIFEMFYNLKKQSYEYLIDPKDHFSRESLIFARIVKAKTKIGYNKPGQKNFDISVPNSQDNKFKHAVQRYMNALELINIPIPKDIPRPELFSDDKSALYIREYLKKLNSKPYILINISASSETRIWNEDNWIELLNNFDGDYEIIVSSIMADTFITKKLKDNIPHLHIFQSSTFFDIIELVKHSELVITPDTSLVHIASAFNKPILALFDDNDDNFYKFRPLSTIQEVVRSSNPELGINGISVSDVKTDFSRIIYRIFPVK